MQSQAATTTGIARETNKHRLAHTTSQTNTKTQEYRKTQSKSLGYMHRKNDRNKKIKHMRAETRKK